MNILMGMSMTPDEQQHIFDFDDDPDLDPDPGIFLLNFYHSGIDNFTNFVRSAALA